MRTNAIHQWLASGSSPPPTPTQLQPQASAPNTPEKGISNKAQLHIQTNQQNSVVKVFVAQSLSQNVEYVCLRMGTETNCKQIVKSLLKKFKLKHRDPNLYYLTLERWIRKDGLKFKSVILLGDDACPLQLQQCCSNPPHNDIRFTLQNRTGTLIRVYCSDAAPDTKYKCLSLSSHTTVNETIELMLHCLNLIPQQKPTTYLNHESPSHQTDCDATSLTQIGHCNLSQQTSHAHSPTVNQIIIHQRTTQTTNSSSSIIDRVRELTNQSPNSTGSADTNSSVTSSYSISSNANVHAALVSNDTSSTSSGIESESTAPVNNVLSINATSGGDKQEPPETRPLADTSSSHAGSITSISSLLVDDNVSSYCDQYSLLIEGAIEGNFRRQVLNPDDSIVDIYEKLLSSSNEEDSAINNTQINDTGSMRRHNSHSHPVGQSSFKFILQRRNQIVAIDSAPSSPVTPQIISPISRQNMPLPALPIEVTPLSTIATAASPPLLMGSPQLSINNIVSTTQIEVNSPTSGRGCRNNYHAQSQSAIVPQVDGFSGFRSGSGRYVSRLASINSIKQVNKISDCNNNYDKPVTRRTTDIDLISNSQANDVVDAAASISIDSCRGTRLPPPPKFIYLAPPIRPRRRNLSNASSTFGRPPTTAIIKETAQTLPDVGGGSCCNGLTTSASNKLIATRRHYTLTQLADDLSKLDVSTSNQNDVADENVVDIHASEDSQLKVSAQVHQSDSSESSIELTKMTTTTATKSGELVSADG